MLEVLQTERYARWFKSLRDCAPRSELSLDREAKARINVRIRRLSMGNPGDVKPVGQGVSELRINYGPSYRVYFVQRGETVVVLLAGGNKRTQSLDIKIAIELARELDQ